jgi:hypothetical protein
MAFVNTSQVANITQLDRDNERIAGLMQSSKRFKDNINNLDSKEIAEKIGKLQPVSFTYTTDEQKNLHYGLIAEDVDLVFPELVYRLENELGEPEIYGLIYLEIIPLLLRRTLDLSENVGLLDANVDLLDSQLVKLNIGQTELLSTTASNTDALTSLKETNIKQALEINTLTQQVSKLTESLDALTKLVNTNLLPI